MESRIITLPQELISKIAAGEVIERPASCIKELIENSIDAQTSSISCKIKGNGAQEIEIADNGIGMTPVELELALKPHTTSKLKNEDDLFRITNFGFRGEALHSILSVAELEISSKTESDEHGFYIKARENEILDKRAYPRTNGTTVRIKNLFWNMPARRKFLKPERTELRYILNVIHGLTLSYPEIAFTLIHDDRKILELPSQTLAQRISSLFGEELFNNLQSVEFNSGVRLSGYFAKPYKLSLKPTIFIFVNKRPCRDRIVKRAVENAYGAVFQDKSPSFIAFLEVPTDFVDVNVHPRKEEVRFKNEGYIYNFVLNAVQNGLGISSQKDGKRQDEDFRIEGTSFWQLHDTYVFSQTESGLLIIDQHAAHERIVYEELMREKARAQHLLFPVLVELTEIEGKYLDEYKEELQKLGFDIEVFGGKTVRIKSIPVTLRELTPELFKAMLLELEEYNRLDKNKLSGVAKLIACKSSVKAESKLNEEEMRVLINRLLECENPYFCPHGRPTIVKITNEELARKFGRT